MENASGRETNKKTPKYTGSRDNESSSKNLGFGKTYKYVMVFRLVFVSSAEL